MIYGIRIGAGITHKVLRLISSGILDIQISAKDTTFNIFDFCSSCFINNNLLLIKLITIILEDYNIDLYNQSVKVSRCVLEHLFILFYVCSSVTRLWGYLEYMQCFGIFNIWVPILNIRFIMLSLMIMGDILSWI